MLRQKLWLTTCGEGTTTGLDEELRDGLDFNLEDDDDEAFWQGVEKEYSALDITFGDSE